MGWPGSPRTRHGAGNPRRGPGSTRGRFIATFCVVLGVVGAAHAEPPRVLLVTPTGSNALVEEAFVRLAAELRTAGFSVAQIAESSSPGPHENVLARFQVTPITPAIVEIRLDESLSSKVSIQRVDVSGEDPERAASRIAIAAIELLRASLLELAVESDRDRSPLPPEANAIVGEVRPRANVHSRAPRVDESRRTRFLVGASGVGLVGGGFEGLAFAPALRLGMLRDRLSLAFTFIGPSSLLRADARGGQARIGQSFALLEAAFVVVPRLPWFRVHVGTGVYRLVARGEALDPSLVEARDHHVAALLDAGLGLRIPITHRFAFESSAHVSLFRPAARIRLGNDVAVTTNPPLASLRIGVSLAL